MSQALMAYAPGRHASQREGYKMKAFRSMMQAAVLTVGVCAVSGVQAQGADVGLVNMLNGDVSFVSSGAAAAKVRPFMKVRQGDRFTLPAGSQVRVVYFQGGRQETWKGPAGFRAGSQSSETSSGSAPEVTTLPSSVPQKIAQVPELMQIAKLGRSGGVSVRGTTKAPKLSAEQLAELKTAKDTYGKLRAQSSADDITPELYLYSVLQDFLLYDDMKPVVEEMAKRQPGNTEVQELVAWVKSRTQ